jgi:hypothetical protein
MANFSELLRSPTMAPPPDLALLPPPPPAPLNRSQAIPTAWWPNSFDRPLLYSLELEKKERCGLLEP